MTSSKEHQKWTIDYLPGERYDFGMDHGYLIGRCGSDVIIGLTPERELLLCFGPGVEGAISLGFLEDPPMPPTDDAEQMTFDWDEWGFRIRKYIVEYGWDQ